MKPVSLQTKVFLDSGDPAETRHVLEVLGFLDGQTTNPSLVAKNPVIQEKVLAGTLSSDEAFAAYRTIIEELSKTLPQGSISVEVYADMESSVDDLLRQARDMYTWAPNLHVKLPCTTAGIEAASILSREGMRLNMTLCFSQAQAAAVHVATLGAAPGQVYISPFIGRLDDKGMEGTDLIQHILTWYKSNGSHVSVLAASIRTQAHLESSIALGADIVTVPAQLLLEWAAAGFSKGEIPSTSTLTEIPYEDLPLYEDWRQYGILHELTVAGIEKFVTDWNKLLTK